jgi:hypothetical protein
MRHSGLLILDARGRTHDQCSQRAKTSETRYIEPTVLGRGSIWRSGGSITTASFYSMEPHKAPETRRCLSGRVRGTLAERV